jgi:arylsulfatase A-like enzyme
VIGAGIRVGELVSSIDIAPPVLELARATIGEQIQGRSFLPLLTGGSARKSWRTSLLIENYSDDRPFPWVLDADYRAIRTDRHKFIHWVPHPEFDELYQLTTDPHEERNVIHQPSNDRVVERLRSDLGKLLQQSISL